MKNLMTILVLSMMTLSANAKVEEFSNPQKACVEVNARLNSLTPFLYCEGISNEGDETSVCLSKEGKRKFHFKQIEASSGSYTVNQLSPKEGRGKAKKKYIRFTAKKVKEAELLSKITTVFDMDTATNKASLTVAIRPSFGGMLLGLEASDSNYQLDCQKISEFPALEE
ncbi:MAG: hypothetical protein HN509_09380 [Halobacteriovoraceae bacterium]|nr:hypothetical protein [Halobacteriovoraceae bacterium]